MFSSQSLSEHYWGAHVFRHIDDARVKYAHSNALTYPATHEHGQMANHQIVKSEECVSVCECSSKHECNYHRDEALEFDCEVATGQLKMAYVAMASVYACTLQISVHLPVAGA